MSLSPKSVVELVEKDLWPAFKAEKERLDKLDAWYRWDHDRPHVPRQSTTEYQQLTDRSQAPWGALIVTAVAQQMYLDGYRSKGAADDSPAWDAWQANGMDARQVPLHRAAFAYGYSFETVLPGTAPDGSPMPVMRGVSPRRMQAFYLDPAEDEWPAYALRADPASVDGKKGWRVRVYDDTQVHELTLASGDARPMFLDSFDHGVGVCPVVRFCNQLDLEGRADGEIEPFIPLFGRIDQTAFDRLVVQRFSSFIVRTIAGMAKPEDADDARAASLLLRVSDLLVADDPDTKFGSLPATPLSGFIEAHEADVRTLAALAQTPAHEMLGQMANLSAEALAAAEASLTRKVEERKHTLGESHEQALRLASGLMGDLEGAADYSAQVRWRDMESRSLSQVADALGKMATMLGVPVQMLWEKIPGWTDQDVEEATRLSQGGKIEALMQQLVDAQTSAPQMA